MYVVLGAAGALGLLTAFHWELGRPMVVGFDHGVQAWVHGWTTPWLTRGMLALTWIGSVRIFLTSVALVVVGLVMRGRRRAAGVLGFALAGALALNETLKLHFHRVRPVVAWSIGDERTFSYPSGHSLFSVALYGTLAYLAMRSGVSWRRKVSVLTPAVLLPLGIGLSRIYLGMHWPTDVLAGYAVGGFWVVVTVAVDRTLEFSAVRSRLSVQERGMKDAGPGGV